MRVISALLFIARNKASLIYLYSGVLKPKALSYWPTPDTDQDAVKSFVSELARPFECDFDLVVDLCNLTNLGVKIDPVFEECFQFVMQRLDQIAVCSRKQSFCHFDNGNF